MVFTKSIINLGKLENAYAAFDKDAVKIFWYGGGAINTVSLSPDCGAVAVPPRGAALYCDQYAFGPDCVVVFEDGAYKIQQR